MILRKAPAVQFTLIRTTIVPAGTFSKKDLAALASYTLERQAVKGLVELTVDLTGHKRIQELNRRFRGVDRTTDVISFRDEFFPHPAFGHLLPQGRRSSSLALPSPFRERVPEGRVRGFRGDLAINVHQAGLQAKRMKHSTRREIRLLLIHGILHLLGYTDYEPESRRRMFKRQNALLVGWERKRD